MRAACIQTTGKLQLKSNATHQAAPRHATPRRNNNIYNFTITRACALAHAQRQSETACVGECKSSEQARLRQTVQKLTAMSRHRLWLSLSCACCVYRCNAAVCRRCCRRRKQQAQPQSLSQSLSQSPSLSPPQPTSSGLFASSARAQRYKKLPQQPQPHTVRVVGPSGAQSSFVQVPPPSPLHYTEIRLR